ncbi:hypothetical protein V865_000768 [Kwoniella europaea PYCC6329]|uniref:DNA topoisomerase (ATP-hydrolyzing) n=1 Tax=Kwoniella europaea PYCC6329 TaxID=1423913 RepID=A0AAX4K8A9_9TREE
MSSPGHSPTDPFLTTQTQTKSHYFTHSLASSQSQTTSSYSQPQSSSYRPKKRKIDVWSVGELTTDPEYLPSSLPATNHITQQGSLELPIDLTQDDDNNSPTHSTPQQAEDQVKSKSRCSKRRRRRITISPSPPPPSSYTTFGSSITESHIQLWNDHYSPPLHCLHPASEPFQDLQVTNPDTQDDEVVNGHRGDDPDNMLLIDMEEEQSQHQDELVMTPDTSSTHRYPFSLTAAPHSPERAHLDEDALEFERLMARHEGKRKYEILAEGGEAKENQNVGNSQTSTTSSKSQREVENLVDEEDEGRTKTLSFLGSIVTNFLSQLHASQILIAAGKEARLKKSSSKKKRYTQERESQENEEELLIIEEDSDEEGLDDGSQSWVQTEPGVTMRLKNRKTGNDQVISFPDDPLSSMGGQTSMEKMNCILRIVTVLYEAVCSRTVVTLRDIYYRDKALFRRQDVVDKLVDDIVATAGLKRRDFFVCASAKGLIAATSLKIIRRTGEEMVLSSTIATLIDPIERIARLDSARPVEWVLVVEKDAVFQTLCSAKLLEDDRLGAGVMITGKGFPDLATRQILQLVSETYPHAKIYALVDADPHGISILSTYAYGSGNTKYSNDHLELPLRDRIEWLGLKATDFKKLGIGYDDLLPLEKADISLAMRMIKDQTLPDEWKRELSHMLHINRKAEIEIILESNTDQGYADGHNLLDDLFDHQQQHYDIKDNDDIEIGKRQEKRKCKLVEYIVERIISLRK